MRGIGSVVGAGLALVLAAFTFDAAVLFVPGVALVLVGALAPPWVWMAARGARLSRTLLADSVEEDQPLEARIEVRSGFFGLPGGEVLDPLAAGVVTLGRSLLAPGRPRVIELLVIARFQRRGRRRFDAPSLVIGDPLGIARIVRQGSPPAQELLVLPRTERLRWARRQPGDRVNSSVGARSPDALAAAEVDGLRPYRPGAPASRIHWPALARGAGLLERRLHAERDSGPLVVLDARCSGPSDELDAAVRAAASLVLEIARRSGCDLLLAPDRRPIHVEPDLGAWPVAHARLALIEGGPDVPAPALAPRPRIGPLYYVAAQRIDRLPAALRGDGHAAAVLVLPETLATGIRYTPSFEVAGCVGFAIGAAVPTGPRVRAA